jgi:uncharacterized membrane protein
MTNDQTLPPRALLAALAFFVFFAALLFVLLGLKNGQPKRQVPVRVGGRPTFFFDMVLLLAHVRFKNLTQK